MNIYMTHYCEMNENIFYHKMCQTVLHLALFIDVCSFVVVFKSVLFLLYKIWRSRFFAVLGDTCIHFVTGRVFTGLDPPPP